MHKVGIGSLSEIKDVRYPVHISVKKSNLLQETLYGVIKTGIEAGFNFVFC